MGLNTDGTSFGLLPFETEMRRRLWWQIVLLDYRASELSGAGPALIDYTWTTKLPLNVNDSDLFPDMRDPPKEHQGVTEMVFVLQRCEIFYAAQEIRNGCHSHEEIDKSVSAVEQGIEQRYLDFCDLSVPLHLLSTLMARTGLSKLRAGPLHPFTVANSGGLADSGKETLFVLYLQMLEHHNTMMGSPILKRFLWHIGNNMPAPALIYCMVALRQRPKGELADRAWKILEESCDRTWASAQHEGQSKYKERPLYVALCNLTMKAWEAS